MKEIAGIKGYELPEVAEILGVHSQTIRNLIKNGKIKATRIGRNYMITEQNLQKYINGD